MREDDSLVMPGLIEDLDGSSIRQSGNLRSETIQAYELANSINQKGLLQPIIVRPKEGFFQIVAGNRRFEACKLLGWKKIPCHIMELDDEAAFEVSLIENIQRQTLNPLDEAKAFKTYVDDFGWGGMAQLAEKLGKNPSYITKRIRLLDLPSDVRDSIRKSVIPPSTAEELFNLDKIQQSEVAKLIVDKHLSIAKTRSLLRTSRNNRGFKPSENMTFQTICDIKISKMLRSFDKCIIGLKLAMHKIGKVLEDNEDWIMYEVLMQHNAVIHAQIDLLLKQKQRRKKVLENNFHQTGNLAFRMLS
jgi:ParB family transcriptional regulator, chromosome partitioning protein